ncbi:MAG TPA: PEP-CTERM sorting domain-containing protein [Edaphobacter sp.]|nr:PEP-CTERM sorting domain-containing protein [Edaphobacter sp.]
MRGIFAVFILALCFSLPLTAHADSFQYTIVDELSLLGPINLSSFKGTYTFTVPSELTGETFIYGPGFTNPPFPGYSYIYASDFTVPDGSPVSQIEITYDPLSNYYGFSLYGAPNGPATSTSLLEATPTTFVADYEQYGYATLEIKDLGDSPTPEPSTLSMFGIGALAIASQIRRRVAHT